MRKNNIAVSREKNYEQGQSGTNRNKQKQTGINRDEHQGNDRKNKIEATKNNIDQRETNMDSKKQQKSKEQKKIMIM